MSGNDLLSFAPVIRVATEQEFMSGSWSRGAQTALQLSGAVLLRTPVSRPDAAQYLLGAIDGELLDDAFWSTPRSRVSDRTLTATEYPSDRVIAPHSEMSYMPSWPRLIGFHCVQAAEEGGETTVCDLDTVSNELGDLLRPFHELGVTYRRRFHSRIDVPWQKAFQTDDRRSVESFCANLGMKTQWLSQDELVTTHTAQGTIGTEDSRSLYFNQAHVFHPSSLPPAVRQAIEKAHGVDGLPRTSTFGDGSPIPESALVSVRDALARHQTRVAWRAGDMLVLDNMRFAHGRLPFHGSRKLHVALARKVSRPVRTPLFA